MTSTGMREEEEREEEGGGEEAGQHELSRARADGPPIQHSEKLTITGDLYKFIF